MAWKEIECPQCRGSGRTESSCSHCGGTGIARGHSFSCSECDGTGKQVCYSCYGTGYVSVKEEETKTTNKKSTWW